MNWSLFISLIVIGFLAIFLYRFIYQRQVVKFQMYLYMNNDPKSALNELNSSLSKILIATDLRKLLSIDAYLALDDLQKLEELFNEVENGKLKPGDHFTVLQKEVSYYTKTNQKDKAFNAYQQMKDLLPKLKAKDNHYAIALKQCEYLVEIQFNHNDKYASELVEKAKEITSNDVASGAYYYQAAQCYYFKNDLKNCEYYLQKAEVKLNKTSSNQRLLEMLNNKDYSGLTQPL